MRWSTRRCSVTVIEAALATTAVRAAAPRTRRRESDRWFIVSSNGRVGLVHWNPAPHGCPYRCVTGVTGPLFLLRAADHFGRRRQAEAIALVAGAAPSGLGRRH